MKELGAMWWGLPVKWAGGAQVPVSSWRAQTAIWNNGGIRSVHFKALVLIVAVLAATQVPAVAADMAPAAPGYLPAAPSAPLAPATLWRNTWDIRLGGFAHAIGSA